MAGIDKTYVTKEEYLLFRQWWIDNYDKMKTEMGGAIWMYPFESFMLEAGDDVEYTPELLRSSTVDIARFDKLGEEYLTLWNTSAEWDKWLINNCPIKAYQDRMLSAYDESTIEAVLASIQEELEEESLNNDKI